MRRQYTPGDGAKTNVESERDALRASLKDCQRRENLFAEQHRYFAKKAETAEYLLGVALDVMAGYDAAHVVVSPMDEAMPAYVERCLPGFTERKQKREAEEEAEL